MDVWQKIEPKNTAWTNGASGRVKHLTPQLCYRELSANTQFELNDHPGTLLLVDQGDVHVDPSLTLTGGDLFWLPADSKRTLSTDAMGALFCLEIENISDTPCQYSKKSEQTWENFEDPAGRPTQPVQVLMDGELSVLRTRFDPDYIAGEHWHDHPTWYFITDGNMRFGHEGWYQTGDIRQVTGGYSYGPEEPGENGVEFVLVSIGGPVNLHWQDLEAAPNGALPKKSS